MSLETTEKAKYKMGPKKSMTGRVKAWLMEMEDYAVDRSKEEFLERYPGEGDVWEHVNDIRQEYDE